MTTQQIIKSYQETFSMYKTAKMLNISPYIVRKTLIKNDIKLNSSKSITKIHLKNENCMSYIDDEYKAYFLGLFFADGNLSGNTASISLQERDCYVLDKISNYFFSQPKKLYFYKKRKESYQNMNKLSISNYIFAKDLRMLNITNNKSLTLKFPSSNQVPHNLLHHFIRGYFDGDGSIYSSHIHLTRFSLNILGSNCFIDTLSKILISLNIKNTIYKEGKISRMNIGNKLDMLKFKEFIYKDSTIFLQRKYDKFQDLIKATDFDKLNKPKYSKFLGISFDKKRLKWVANVKRNQKNKFLGYFSSEEEASEHRKNYLINILGETKIS